MTAALSNFIKVEMLLYAQAISVGHVLAMPRLHTLRSRMSQSDIK